MDGMHRLHVANTRKAAAAAVQDSHAVHQLVDGQTRGCLVLCGIHAPLVAPLLCRAGVTNVTGRLSRADVGSLLQGERRGQPGRQHCARPLPASILSCACALWPLPLQTSSTPHSSWRCRWRLRGRAAPRWATGSP